MSWLKKKPPTDWRKTSESRYRVLSVCDGYRLVREQEKWIEFVGCEVQWRDKQYWSQWSGSSYYDEVRSPIRSDSDEVRL